MKKTLLFVLAAVISACTYPFTPDLPTSGERQLVVEGNICIGESSLIRLGAVKPLSSEAFVSWEGDEIARAEVCVEDDAGFQYPVTGSVRDGFIIRTERAPVSREYKLSVRVVWKGDPEVEDFYETPWLEVHPAPEIGDITFRSAEGMVNVGISLTPSETDNPYYFWEYDENWETHAQYVPTWGFDMAKRAYYELEYWVNPNYYCWHSSVSREAVLYSTEKLNVNLVKDYAFRSISRTDTRFQILYSINVRVRGVSPDGYRYYRSVAEGSNLTGDLFSVMPDRTPGNIRCTSDPSRFVVGYVEAVTTASKRVFIDSRYYVDALPDEREAPQWDEEDVPRDEQMLNYYNSGNRPLYYGKDILGRNGMLWCPLRCIDCVVAGGTKDKPDFWPNDHK